LARPAKAFEHAIAFLQQKIDTLRNDGTGYLPSLDELAYEAGIGQRTIFKAIHELKRKGELIPIQGRGVFIRSCTSGIPQSAPDTFNRNRYPRHQWEKLVVAIEEDIRRRHFDPNAPLPSTKQLTTRYGVCHQTLKKALDELLRKNRLMRYKKGYRLVWPTATTPTYRNSVVLFARGDTEGNLIYLTSRTQQYLRTLEQACAQANLTLEIIPISCDQQNIPVFLDQTRFLRNTHSANVMGFIIWYLGIDVEFPSVLQSLSGTKKPICVFDERGGCTIPESMPLQNAITIFSISNDMRDGEHVGQYLFNSGHRHIAFVSPFHFSEWSQNRLKGLERAVHPGGKTYPFVITTPNETSDFISQSKVVARTAQQLLTTNPLQIEMALHNLEHDMRQLQATIAKSKLKQPFDHQFFIPLLRHALRHKRITAWVAANDETALACLQYIRTHHIQIPQKISIIGFNDSLEAFFHGISSYNFNVTGIMNAMLYEILHPTFSRKMKRIRRKYIDGYVSIRATSMLLP